MKIATVSVLTVMSIALFGTGLAHAGVSPEAKCEAGKNQESGKYAFCLHKAEAKLLKTKGVCSVTTTNDCYRDDECPTGETCQKATIKYDDAVTKCEDKYAAKWNTLETKAAEAMATCPDEPLLQADVKQVIDECVSDVASGLAGEGLPDCAGDLLTCTGDLGTCNSSLSTCNSNYSTCSGSLTTCNTTLTSCQGELNDCQNPTCGDNSADLGEQCDGSDLNGATCASLGFTGGTLTCSSCAFDTSGCSLPVDACGDGDIDSGEDCDGTNLNGGSCVGEGFGGGTLGCGANCLYSTSSCYATRFVDNGNGTISDYETGLTWEKKADLDNSDVNCTSAGVCPDPHDADNRYGWTAEGPNPGTAYTVFLAQLNDGGGFAGHTDWRLPTREELRGIVDYADSTEPTVNAVFDTSCTASCTVTSCSCTAVLSTYWSSSTLATDSGYAWLVYFGNGDVSNGFKGNNNYVRAVRTGL